MTHNQMLLVCPKQIQRFFNYAFEGDLDFYEEYTIHLPDEEQKKFFQENTTTNA